MDQDRWIVNVPVATLWTSPEAPREVDQPGITNPVDLPTWLNRLSYQTRLDLCEQNLVQSQLLYGEEVIVLEEKQDWLQVIVPTQPSKKDSRGYPGWIPACQAQPKPDAKQVKGKAVVSSKLASLYDEKQAFLLELSYLTALPLLGVTDSHAKVLLPDATPGYLYKSDVEIVRAGEEVVKGSGTDIVRTGEAFLGLEYFWGGMSAYGYDCSGFSYNMYKANGHQIPRDASDQAALGGEEIAFDQLLPGDLLFFAYEEGKGTLHHVGMYYGDGKMIHSPTTGKSIEITTLAGTVYEKELCGARRYWQETEGAQ
ncbi:peptidase [Sediminibacillus dalangtanensis]|uniref:Peptidase n=1 Tax=Sediminibacillus dalangtanensis TaxID=2729421 RepID=A0ABX7W180_9BACI|nr:C40 family peptidase [Sediminibacillus dalangtanensis]QTN00843.1 peptidase [Sediminibacillus dalangtanensis]